MDDELAADRYVDRRADADVVGGAAIACECVDMHGFFGNAARNAAIDDVDRSADRLARKEQHGGAAQNLDALGGPRVDADAGGGGGSRGADRHGERKCVVEGKRGSGSVETGG